MTALDLLVWALVLFADLIILFVLSAVVVGVVRGIKAARRDRGK